jgi:hypothetical protein
VEVCRLNFFGQTLFYIRRRWMILSARSLRSSRRAHPISPAQAEDRDRLTKNLLYGALTPGGRQDHLEILYRRAI